MPEHLLHPLPARGAVVREQLALVALSMRRPALLAAGALGLFTLWTAWMRARGFGQSLDFAPQVAVPAILLFFVAPLGLWAGEDPSRRGYHWAMPVGRAEHALARAGAGWAWAMAALAVYLTWAMGLAAATGGSLGMEWRGVSEAVHAEGAPFGQVAVEPWRWAVPFAAGTVMYLLGSAIVLRFRHPIRWMAGIPVGLMALSAFQQPLGRPILPLRVVESVFHGRWGVETLWTGAAPTPVWNADGGFTVVTRMPDAGVWLTTLWIWMAVALTLFLWAAYRQPEA